MRVLQSVGAVFYSFLFFSHPVAQLCNKFFKWEAHFQPVICTGFQFAIQHLLLTLLSHSYLMLNHYLLPGLAHLLVIQPFLLTQLPNLLAAQPFLLNLLPITLTLQPNILSSCIVRTSYIHKLSRP
jgi:hypothetical protein